MFVVRIFDLDLTEEFDTLEEAESFSMKHLESAYIYQDKTLVMTIDHSVRA